MRIRAHDLIIVALYKAIWVRVMTNIITRKEWECRVLVCVPLVAHDTISRQHMTKPPHNAVLAKKLMFFYCSKN